MTILIILFYKKPFLSKFYTLGFTALFIIYTTELLRSESRSVTSALAALVFLILTVASIYAILRKDKIININLGKYFVSRRNKIATDEEISFFITTSCCEEYKKEFENYLNGLNRKPLIKECLIKLLELNNRNMRIDA